MMLSVQWTSAVTKGLVAAIVGLALMAGPRAIAAHESMALGSSASDGGSLALEWDFDDPVETFLAFCSANSCLYSTLDPGFRGLEQEEHDLFPLVSGTVVGLEVVARDPAVSLRIDGNSTDVGKVVSIGTGPSLHTHPSWQLLLTPGTPEGEYTISYKLKTDSPLYGESPVYTSILVNVVDDSTPSPTATATATATPMTASVCPGDCDGGGDVTVDEIVRGVNVALSGVADATCPALDSDSNGSVTVDDLVRAINAALGGCVAAPTRTPEPLATASATPPPAPTVTPTAPVEVPSFARIQTEILTPRCAVPFCHAGAALGGGLSLVEGSAYDQLVGVTPAAAVAADAGYLRVDAGRPDTSFLLLKLVGPSLAFGSRMPIGGALSSAQIELVRAWILGGAPR